MDAARGRMRPPPPPRRHPITAAAAAITFPITTATPVAITAPECATIDAPALSRPLSPDAPHGQVHLGHRHYPASTVDFPRPAAAAAVTPVAATALATILAATADIAERCDVWEGRSALPPPGVKKGGM